MVNLKKVVRTTQILSKIYDLDFLDVVSVTSHYFFNNEEEVDILIHEKFL